jgi:triosephosphate isomerase
MGREIIFAGNWKMHKKIGEAIELANGLLRELRDIEDCRIIICPPFTALSEVKDVIMDSNIKLGAQNMFWEKEGAYTGEISPLMLKDVGCEYVIIGHSERRKYFGEDDQIVNRKIKSALESNLNPIFCLGETLDERKSGKTLEVVEIQLLGGLKEIGQEEMKKITIAYEPVWAIGTGVNATPQQAEEVQAFIRDKLSEIYGEEIAERISILYGGSVKPDNIEELMAEKDIDGVLVGGASLKVDSFSQIVKKGLNIKIGR